MVDGIAALYMEKKFYNNIFGRNKVTFNDQEIQRIKKLKVAICGAGSLGGYTAMFLTNLGIDEIRIVDPECFEFENVNRQFGATIGTVGMPKVEAVRNELLKIHPGLCVRPYYMELKDVDTDLFFREIDFVIDAIDFFNQTSVIFLHQEIRKRGLWCFTAQGVMSTITFICYNPNDSRGFLDFFVKDKTVDIIKLAKYVFPNLVSLMTPDVIKQIQSGDFVFPAHLVLPPVGAAILIDQVIKIFVRNVGSVSFFPEMFGIDLEKMNFFNFRIPE